MWPYVSAKHIMQGLSYDHREGMVCYYPTYVIPLTYDTIQSRPFLCTHHQRRQCHYQHLAFSRFTNIPTVSPKLCQTLKLEYYLVRGRSMHLGRRQLDQFAMFFSDNGNALKVEIKQIIFQAQTFEMSHEKISPRLHL